VRPFNHGCLCKTLIGIILLPSPACLVPSETYPVYEIAVSTGCDADRLWLVVEDDLNVGDISVHLSPVWSAAAIVVNNRIG